MLKRANSTALCEVSTKNLISGISISSGTIVSNPIKSESSEINNLIQDLANEASLKQEELIQGYKQKQILNLQLTQTANPKFLLSKNGKYYSLKEYDYIEEPSITNVDEAGNYVKETNIKGSRDILVITYDIANKPVAIKVVNAEHLVYKSERYVAQKLNMRKEFVHPYKLHGYSGNSTGIIAKIKNMLSKSVPTGCYLSNGYNFYRWSIKNSQFELNVRDGRKIGSPLMADYEINDNIVVRTDYDGAGIVM